MLLLVKLHDSVSCIFYSYKYFFVASQFTFGHLWDALNYANVQSTKYQKRLFWSIFNPDLMTLMYIETLYIRLMPCKSTWNICFSIPVSLWKFDTCFLIWLDPVENKMVVLTMDDILCFFLFSRHLRIYANDEIKGF